MAGSILLALTQSWAPVSLAPVTVATSPLLRGIVPRVAHGQTTPAPTCSACLPPLAGGGGTYVMGGVSGAPGQVIIHPVYWAPPGYSFTAGYKSIINGYLQNVSAAS